MVLKIQIIRILTILNGAHVPRESEDTFLAQAHKGANNAASIDMRLSVKILRVK